MGDAKAGETKKDEGDGARGDEDIVSGNDKEVEEAGAVAEKKQGEEEKKEKGEKGGGGEEETEESETRREQRADVDRHMAKLYITVLQEKHQELSRGGGEFSRVPRENEDLQEEEDGFGAGFARLGVGELPMCDPITVPLDFESIRDVFKRAKVGHGGGLFFLFFL